MPFKVSFIGPKTGGCSQLQRATAGNFLYHGPIGANKRDLIVRGANEFLNSDGSS